jgi:hypothetical protein
MYSQSSFTVDDLLDLSSLPSKKIGNYMEKKGFAPASRTTDKNMPATSFFEKTKRRKRDTAVAITRNIDLYKKGNSLFYALHTLSQDDYKNGQVFLRNAGFFCSSKNIIEDTAIGLFQKGNVLIETSSKVEDSIQVYTFLLQKKQLPHPDSISFAEDLLAFDSHEYLVSFFGQKNVKKDLYFLSEKELKSCSVIFGNSRRQAVFVWDDEKNMRGLSFVLISDVMPTVEATNFDGTIYNNEWRLKNGIHAGMSIAELVMRNKKDFLFYGSQSKSEYRIMTEKSGELDFSTNQVVLGCNNCNGTKIMNSSSVSAMQAVQENMGMYVYYLMLFPKKVEMQTITRKN